MKHQYKTKERPISENTLECSDNKFVDVDTGEVRISSKPVILRAMAIGSCVAVAVYHRYKKIGGLAHIMLPGRSLKEESECRTKYAENALDILFDKVNKLDIKIDDLEVSLVGGANVLDDGNIPDLVVRSVLDYLKKLNIRWKGKMTGGKERRSVFLDTTSGKLFYTEGDSAVKKL